MAVIAVGVDHEHASLDLLERVSIPEHRWGKVLRELVSHRNIHEAVFVSTCLRTEVIATIDFFHSAIEDVTRTLAAASGVEEDELAELVTVSFDRGVARHLFEVAAGLRSVVPGEYEVLGQLRRALEVAEEEHTAGPELVELFHRALASGRRVRTETAIARGTTSFASAAVALALEGVGDEIAGAPVVVVGAGQLASGVAKSLVGLHPPIGELVIVNRTLARAESLAQSLEDPRVHVAGLDALPELLTRVRLAVVAAETSGPLVTTAHQHAVTGPLLMVDLGLPRAVVPTDAAGVRRLDLDDLRERVDAALVGRREAVGHARSMVEADVDHYLEDRRSRGASPVVRALREHFDEIVATELARRAGEFAEWSPDQRDQLSSVVRSVVAKIAHRPTAVLKEAAGSEHGVRLSDSLRTLFDL